MALWLPEKRAGQNAPFDFFGLTTFSLGTVGLQMLLDRGERLDWFNSAEIWAEAAASVLGFYLYLAHILTSKAHFLDKALLSASSRHYTSKHGSWLDMPESELSAC
jgi:MFS transporter, DHA2 family, multidrug resistance protein